MSTDLVVCLFIMMAVIYGNLSRHNPTLSQKSWMTIKAVNRRFGSSSERM